MISFIKKVTTALAVIVVLGFAQSAFAQVTPTITSVAAGGSWTSPDTWVEGRVPNPSDSVQINGSVSMRGDIDISGLHITSGSALRGYRFTGYTMTVNGDFHHEGLVDRYTRLVVDGSIESSGDYDTGNLRVTGGSTQYLKGNFPLSLLIESDLSLDNQGDALRVKGLGTGNVPYEIIFADTSSVFEVETLGSNLTTNVPINFVLMDGFVTRQGDNVTAPEINIYHQHKIGAIIINAENMVIYPGGSLYPSSSFTNTDIVLNGGIDNRGTVTRYMQMDITGSFQNTGSWQSAPTLTGPTARILAGTMPGLVTLGSDILIEQSVTEISFNNLQPLGNSVTFQADDASLLVNTIGGGIITNASITFFVPDGATITRASGDIIAQNIIIDGLFRAGTITFDADEFIINEGASIIPSSNFTNYDVTIHADVKNYGSVTSRYIRPYIYGSIYNTGSWPPTSYLSWPADDADEYELEIGSDRRNLDAVVLSENRTIKDPISNTTISNIVNDDEIRFWRVRPVGGQWSELFTINGELDESEPDFFSISEIPDITLNEVTITITALDPNYSGFINISTEQGQVSPLRVFMENGVANPTIVLKDSAYRAKISVSSRNLYGFSNLFNIGAQRDGNIDGTINGQHIGVNVTASNAFQSFETMVQSGGTDIGKFYFSDIPCGRYSLELSGQTEIGEEVRSLPETVNVSCTGITYHMITSASFANCNPEGLTPVLLVPGILGSTSGGILDGVYPDLPAVPPTWDSGELRLHDPGFFRQDLDLDVTNPVGFKKIKEKLKIGDENGNNKYKQNCTIFDAPYYWADSSEKNARNYLKKYIDYAIEISGNTQVDIIAHSMGGIVTRSYIQNENLYGNDIRKFAMVGTPNAGSPLPYFIYEGGDVIGADTVTGITGIFKTNRYFYTHSLNKFYRKKIGEDLCKNIPIIGAELYPQIFPSSIFKSPQCDRQKTYDFARSDNLEGLKDLLFTYDEALFDNETNSFINYPVNESVINLNTDYDILNDDINTKLFVGVEEENTTLQTLVVLPSHDDIFYQDYGYPQYEYPVRSPGDGTVPQISSEIPDLDIYGVYDESHGALPNKSADDLVKFIMQN